MTDRILQQVSSDATIPSLDRSVSFEIIPAVIQNGDHIADQDADDDEDQGHVMYNVQESIVVGRTLRNSRKLSWFTTNMIVAYALSVVEEVIP